jgi:mono/diheme cytochrome c family protein
LTQTPRDNGSAPKAEIDYVEALRTPRKYFGLAYVGFIALALVLGVTYLSRLTALTKNSVGPAILADSAGLVTDIPVQFPRNLPPVNVSEIAVSTPELIARGKEAFQANCSSCHGTEGRGDGQAGLMLNPRPRNFHDLKGWTYGSKITQIYKTLEEGIPKTGMAPFNYLPPADRFALAHFVRSLAMGQPMDTHSELAMLDSTYNLSAGRVVPGHIPISKAIVLVAAEAKPLEPVWTLPTGNDEVFRRVVRDPQKALTALIAHHPRFSTAGEFLQVVSPSPEELGFSASVNALTRTEWDELYHYVEGIREHAH